MEVISIRHTMPCGDLLSILPGLRQLYKATGKKIRIYQKVNLAYSDFSGAYMGATYSIKNENDVPVTMNWAVFEAVRPLLLHQEYIEDFLEWDGEKVDYDFDMLRYQETTMYYGSINRWPFYVWPEMSCDLSHEWLNIPPGTSEISSGKILINRTERYNNMYISYNFLRFYGDNVLFVGLPKEHEVFCQQHNLKISRLEAANFLEIAIAMQSCKLFIGNQSALFQMAEGLKINRVLEVCKQMPNVIGCGRGFYDFLHPSGLEYSVEKLLNE